MQLFTDFNFFVYAAILSIPALILGILEKPIKYYGFAVTLFFIWLAMGHNRSSLIWLTFFCVFEFKYVGLRIKFDYHVYSTVG